MYQTHFNLPRKPFHLGPDINHFYAGDTHARALDYLERSLNNEGLFVLTGGPGTGKTTLLNKLEEIIPRQFYVARINISPKMKPQELMKLVISSFGIKSNQLSSNTEMLLEIEEFLLAQAHQKQQVIIFVDDCHHLSDHSLEELVLLTKIHVEGTPLIQCLLTGQSSFRHTIDTPEFEQLNQFIATTHHLESLSEEETREYISHRLITAGHETGDIFTPKASQIIHEYTLGVPRKINQVCARTLHYAADENETSINEGIVFNTIDESFAELETPAEATQYSFEAGKNRPQLQDRRMHCRRLTDRRAPGRRENFTTQHNQYTGEESIYPQLEEVVFGIAVQRKTDATIIEGKKTPLEDEKPRLANLRFPINEFFRRRNRMKNRNQNPYTTAVLLIIIPIVYFMLAPNETTDQNVIANAHALENSTINRQIITIAQASSNPANETTNFVAPPAEISAPAPVEQDAKISEQSSTALSPQFAELDALGAIGIRSKEQPIPTQVGAPPSTPTVEAKPATTRVNTATPKAAAPKKEKTAPAKPKIVKPKPVTPKPKAIVNAPPKPKSPPVIVKEPAKLEPDNLHLVINKFTEAYKSGNIKKISSILSEDIKTNDSDDKETLTSQYRKLFSITDDRNLTFTNISWKTETDEAAGSGDFKASILEKGRTTPQVYSGTFTIELKKENTQIAITDLRYEYE